jgi:hypothetical protein
MHPKLRRNKSLKRMRQIKRWSMNRLNRRSQRVVIIMMGTMAVMMTSMRSGARNLASRSLAL